MKHSQKDLEAQQPNMILPFSYILKSLSVVWTINYN